MNHDKRSFSHSSKPLTTEEIMALIGAKTPKPVAAFTGTDYFAKNSGQCTDGLLPDKQSAILLRVNDHADQQYADATLLNNKDGIKNFKAVAPTAPPTTASSCDDGITSRTKPLAPAADEPEHNAADVSLRSSADEQETKGTCGADDDTPTTKPDGEPECDAVTALDVDPQFFKVRADLFDNGEVKNKTRFTAKLSMQIHQDDDPANNAVTYANFYSRSRDFKAFVEKKNCWDAWYEEVATIFDETCRLDRDFEFKPMISILKERDPETRVFGAVRHTACIFYKAHGRAPVLMILYGLWVEKFSLNAQFKAKCKNAPMAIGYYVDPERAHLDVQKQSPPMKIKTARDFQR